MTALPKHGVIFRKTSHRIIGTSFRNSHDELPILTDGKRSAAVLALQRKRAEVGQDIVLPSHCMIDRAVRKDWVVRIGLSRIRRVHDHSKVVQYAERGRANK